MPNSNVLTAEARATIMDACQSISRSADALKAGCEIDDEWPDADDKAFYDGELRLLERLTALLAAHPGQPEPRDAIARSKRILALIDEYHENPTRDTRTALRVALMDEFRPEPRAEATDDDKVCARRYRWLRSQMKVGSVRTDLPLYTALYWVGLESCTDLKHADDAIDTERRE